VIASVSGVQQALADGGLDMTMIAAAGAQTRDLWKVTTAITRTDHADYEFLVINENTWQSLSDRHKSILTQAARRAERVTREWASLSEAAAYEIVRIDELTASEIAEWRACNAGGIVEYMERAGR
jgi:C4-dicarboxylate-binding protein DctP